MLNPKIIQKSIHQVNMDRNLNLSVKTIHTLVYALNRTFNWVNSPAENITKIEEEIREYREKANQLSKERDQLKVSCQHVWLSQIGPNEPYFCKACSVEVSL